MQLTYLVQYFSPEKSSGLDLVEDLLEGFVKCGWNIHLYTPMPTKGITIEQRKNCEKIEQKYNGKLIIHRMPLYREGKSFISRTIRYLIFSIECFWKAITVPADFIFTGSGPPTQGFVVGLAKKLLRNKPKVIYNLQDIFPDSLIASGICNKKSLLFRIGRLIENFTYKNADVIITITDDMRENILRKGVSLEKIKVVRNWIDTEKIIPVERKDNKLFDEFHLPRDKFYVVYAGNLGRVQGVEIVIEAAELLKEYHDISFIIFGNGSEEEKIKSLITEKNLPSIQIFPLLPPEKISEVYSLGDVSIVSCKAGTSKSGMPSKTWTIMATGTPILASFDLGGEMERTIKEAKCGYCVEAGNADKLAEVILQLSTLPQRIIQLGTNARNYAVNNISKEKAIQQYIKIIEKTGVM